jgi:hypothetical protein
MTMIPGNRFVIPDQDLHQDHQDQQQPDQPQFNSFRGLYIGPALIDHLNSVDPNQEYWFNIADYINSFPYSKSFFETTFPFYMGSHIRENELVAFYQTDFCECVDFFQMNHPDWSEYSESECLQHFKDAIEHYADECENYSSLVYRMFESTPPTLEKPHFSVYQERYVEETNEYQERFIGVGYFSNVDGQTIPHRNQMGTNGPFGYSQMFNLQMHLDQLVANESMNSLDDVREVPNLHFYTHKIANNVEFAFHTDPETFVQSRFLCNENDDLFLFEESFQREKEEKRIERVRKEVERVRKEEEKKKKYEEEKRKREMEMKQREERQRNISTDEWLRSTSQAFRTDTPLYMEIQARLASQSILPFQHVNLPLPVVNPTDYREPLPHYNEDEEDEVESHLTRYPMCI